MDLALEGDVRLLFFEHDNAHEVRAGPPGSLPPHPPAGIEGPTRAGPMGPFGVRKKRSVDRDGKNGAWIAMARIIAIDGSHYLLSSSGLPDADSSQGGWGWVWGGVAGWGGVPQRASSKPSQRPGAGWSLTKGRQWLEPDLAPTCLLQWCVFLSTLEPDQGSTTACPFRALSGPAAALRPSHRRLLSCRASTPRHPKLLQPVTPRLPGPLWKGDVPMWFW